MTVYTLSSSLPEDSFIDWTQTSLWAQGNAPDDSGAQVYFNDTGSDYFVEIAQAETISIGSFSLAANHLLLAGTLVSAGSVSVAADAGLQIYGGSLSAQSLHLNGTPLVDVGLLGVGTVTVAGPIYNDSAIISGTETGLSSLTTLTLNAAYIDNLGLLEASVASTLTVTVTLASGLANDAYGTLTGGTYDAESNATLNLGTNGVIVNDAATLILDGAGTDVIASFNPSTGQYVPIQSSLTEVTAAGTLELDAASYTTGGTLTVEGMLRLVGAANFSAGTLYVTSGGAVDLSDAYPGESMTLSAGRILNNGQIFVDAAGGAIATIAGPVSGAGSIVLGPAVTSILRYGGPPVITTANAELTGADSNSLTFSDGTGSFLLDVPASFTGAVQHFTAGDSILLPSVAPSSVTAYSYAGSASSGVLTLQEGNTPLHLTFTGSYTTADFALSTDPASGGLAITGTSLIGVAPASHPV
jgi:hypothetical protein